MKQKTSHRAQKVDNGHMSRITFVTLKFATRLIDAGVGEAQAKAEAEALRDVFAEVIDSTVATRSDINRIEGKIDTAAAKTEGKFNLLQWMIGFNLAFSMALLWKIFG